MCMRAYCHLKIIDDFNAIMSLYCFYFVNLTGSNIPAACQFEYEDTISYGVMLEKKPFYFKSGVDCMRHECKFIKTQLKHLKFAILLFSRNLEKKL